MIIPLLITGSILGGLYFLAPRVDAPRTEDRPTRVIPTSEISPDLQRRMVTSFVALPPNLQQQFPPPMWGDPNGWIQLAQTIDPGVLSTIPRPPMMPTPQEQLAEQLAQIGQLLQGLPMPPVPGPAPGPVPLPPGLGTQAATIANQLAAEIRTRFPALADRLPTTPGAAVDPFDLDLAAAYVEVFLGLNRPEAPVLRTIAADLRQSAPRARAPMTMGPMGPARSNYEQIILNQGGTVTPGLSQALAFLQQYGGAPPVSGIPSRVAGESSRYALHPSAFGRRRYAGGLGYR